MVREIDARNATQARTMAPKAAILREAGQPGKWFAFDTPDDAIGHLSSKRS